MPEPVENETAVLKPLAYKPNTVAEITGLSRSSVFKLLREKKLDSVTVGRSRLILAQSVEKLLSSEAA
ncbi:helix-turn-helix domain-containing protein [Altericroceibacterium xinjiangense]|uniref:helix-turn-helix domain-containing protein n=1 Tax=Altericroceibacterium xinjiangense TaxID=762261 RepID=UPI000F7DE67C|nr:helix-turn-helix domain-containing protein [Altericroceibacterium xinjiangense]